MLRAVANRVCGEGLGRCHRANGWGVVRALSNARAALLLPDRALLAVEGPDKAAFLQGMVTNDVTKLKCAGGTETALFANFLNAKGRFRFDAFVASFTADSPLATGLKANGSTTEETGFLIDTSADQAGSLEKYLKLRTLGSKVKVRKVPGDSFAVKQYLPQGTAPVQIEEEDLSGPALLFNDPRTERMGVRVIEMPASIAGEGLCHGDDALLQYRFQRLLCGIAEGPRELEVEKTVPLEASLHYFNTICFTKGCYVGQELMARVHFTGTLRKQAITLLLPEESPASETEWTSYEAALERGSGVTMGGQAIAVGDTVSFVKAGEERGRRVGKVMAVEGRAVLVMMRFQCLEDTTEGGIGGTLCIAGECGDTIAASRVVRPHWWAERPVER